MNFDTKCYELAEHFMEKTQDESALKALAQHIQDSIEDWLAGYGPTDPPAHFKR